MPMTEAQSEALRVYRETGSKRETARQLGKAFSGVHRLIAKAEAYEAASYGEREAADAVSVDVGSVKQYWAKTDKHGNVTHSVLVRNNEAEKAADDLADRVAERLANVPPAPMVSKSHQMANDVLTFLPIFDAHIGLQIGKFGREDSAARVIEGVHELLATAPPAEAATILIGGDFTHQNDKSNQTPKSKHPLDIDGSYGETVDAAIDCTITAIEMARQIHGHVFLKAIEGNHDPHTPGFLRAAIKGRYGNAPDVHYMDGYGGSKFMLQRWGDVALFGHHGDTRTKPKDIAMNLAHRFRSEWGMAARKEMFTGHYHHLKVESMPGVTWTQVRAISRPSRYDIDEFYTSPASIPLYQFNKNGRRAYSGEYEFEAFDYGAV